MRLRLQKALGVLLALSTVCLLLSGSLWTLGTNAPWMAHLMRTVAPPEATGLLPEEYDPIAALTCDYLSGKTDTFQQILHRPGGDVYAFRDDEQHHMQDVQGLFRLCRTVLILSGVMALIALTLLLILRPRHWGGWWGGLIGILSLLLIPLVWAVIDYDSLFVLFHRLAFTNELWLLNPQTDLLIRLMPLRFFITDSLIVCGVTFGLPLIILAFSFMIRRKKS